MKARFFSFCVFLFCITSNAGDGQLILQNRNIVTGSGLLYHVPIWIDLNGNGALEPGEGIGSYAAALGQTATLGLYLQGESTPLASVPFRSDLNGQFLSVAGLDVFVPGYTAGQQAPLTIKVWIGSSFDTASIRGSWNFLSPPLGGTLPDAPPKVPPTLEGWGDQSGVGFTLTAPGGPLAGADVITRRSLSDAHVSIAQLLANDSDPTEPIVFVRVDPWSNSGASVTVADGRVTYHTEEAIPDYFFYTIRNSVGLARGRVDVLINDPEGMIVFSNRDIPTAAGNQLYDVPIFVDGDSDGVASSDEAIGKFATRFYSQPAQLGIFLKGTATPLAVAKFSGDSFYLGDPPSQTVVIPNAPPGSRIDLTIKAWIGSNFEASTVRVSWDILSQPLGGFIDGGASIKVPGVAPWGNDTTNGYYLLSAGPQPVAATDEVAREYRKDATISVETLLANDSDTDGGKVTFVGVDPVSKNAAMVTLSGATITYKHNTEADDYFFYTIRSTHGAIAKGRVNVKAGEPIGEIIFSNSNITKASGVGTYNVPLFVDYNTNGVSDVGEDISSFAALFGKTATLGLFQRDGAQPIATLDLTKPTIAFPVGIGAPPSLNSITFTSGVGGGIAPGTVYIATFNSEPTFTVRSPQGDLWGRGTYVYTPDYSNNTAHLRMNYVDLPGDFDDLILTFNNSGANSFSGTQGVSGTIYPYPGTFTFSSPSVPHSFAASILVPGFRPGDQAPLTIKAWVGPDYESATVKKSWDFTSLPLGGPSGNTNIPAPGLTGWGNENGQGYAIEGGPAPVVGDDTVHVIQTTIFPVINLLPNDSDPAGGTIQIVKFDPVSHNGLPIYFFNNASLYFERQTTGTDYFSYQVVTSAGGVGTGTVAFTVDPCVDCSGDPGGGGGSTTSGGDGSTTGGPGGGVILPTPVGKIFFSTRLVRKSTDSGTYNIPVWVDSNFNGRRDGGEGIGSFAHQSGQSATLGLFLRGAPTPLATARFYSDIHGAFLQEPEFQTVTITGATPGSTAHLTLKAWVGSSFDSALVKGSWDFDSLPLGGAAGDTIDIPDLSGLGDEENGTGLAISPGLKPITYGQLMTRSPEQNVNTKIADMIKNDTDPEGGALTLVSVDETSREGAVITVLGDTVYYIAAIHDTDTPDYFEYTVRNAKGGIAKGRVDVVVTDAQGEFHTRLAIEPFADGNHISFRGVIGANYLVQFRETIDGAWQDLGPAVHEAFGMFKFTDTAAAPPIAGVQQLTPSPPVRFYQVMME